MKRSAIAAVLALLTMPSFAQLQDETLLVAVPQGYKVDFQTRQGNMLLTEMVPEGESVQTWTEMLTVQVFLGLKNATPAAYGQLMRSMQASHCKGSLAEPITDGQDNGYAFAVWKQSCPVVQQTGKPEITFVKAVRGNDSFYVVQKAFRSDPSAEQVIQWTQFLKAVKVCDPRIADRACVATAAAPG